jgi:hypothetical protein
MWARIKGGKVVEYPIMNLRAVFPEISLPADLSNDSDLPEGYVNVLPGSPPELPSGGHKVLEGTPTKVKGKWYRSYEVVKVSPEELQVVNDLHQVEAKTSKSLTVSNLMVTTTSGKSFNACDDSQSRMTTAILVMKESKLDSIHWKLADNCIVEVSLEELVEALTLAFNERSKLWL